MRFKIRTIMLAIAAVALVLVSLRDVRILALQFLGGLLASCLALGRGLWLGAKPFPRVSALGFGIAASIINGTCFVASVAFSVMVGWLIMVLVSVVGIPVIFGFGAAWTTSGKRGPAVARRSRVLGWTMTIGLSIAPVSMLITGWPFRLAFAASRPSLERLADQVAAGTPVTAPEWAGVFRILGSNVDPLRGCVRLITDNNPGGRAGFERHGTLCGDPFYNTARDMELSEKWTYAEED